MSNNKSEISYNPLILPLIFMSMAAIMYMFAFHNERDQHRECKEANKIEIIAE